MPKNEEKEESEVLGNHLNVSDETRRSDEYNSLREQMLFLVKRGFDTWQWSLVAVVALIGTVLFKFIELSIKKTNLHVFLFAFVILFFSAMIIWVFSKVTFSQENTLIRLGAYLAIFHEAKNKNDRRAPRFHILNRVDQFLPRMEDIDPKVRDNLVLPNESHSSVSTRSYVYDILFIFVVMVVVETVWIIPGTKPVTIISVAGLGVIMACSLYWRLRVWRKAARESHHYWIKRWCSLRNEA